MIYDKTSNRIPDREKIIVINKITLFEFIKKFDILTKDNEKII